MIFRTMTFRFAIAKGKPGHIRWQLQSLYLVSFQPRSQQIKPSDHLFVFAEILWTIGEYQVTLIPMNIMHSQCVAFVFSENRLTICCDDSA